MPLERSISFKPRKVTSISLGIHPLHHRLFEAGRQTLVWPKEDGFKVDLLQIKEAFDVKKKILAKEFWSMLVTQKCLLAVEETKIEREFANAIEYGVVVAV